MEDEVKIEEKIPEGVEQLNEVKDDVYRLQEMSDEMLKSLENLKNVKQDQEYLVEALTKTGDEKLKPLIGELTKQLGNLNYQIERLTTKQILIENICLACEDTGIRMIVNNLLAGLSVFEGR